jgi:hypothetical protein
VSERRSIGIADRKGRASARAVNPARRLTPAGR